VVRASASDRRTRSVLEDWLAAGPDDPCPNTTAGPFTLAVFGVVDGQTGTWDVRRQVAV